QACRIRPGIRGDSRGRSPRVSGYHPFVGHTLQRHRREPCPGTARYPFASLSRAGNLLDALDLALGTYECQGGERVLDDRKLTVLRAIVEDYVSTTEPVGSKSLVDRHHFDVSPATIRNDMAVLEEEGFIAQPHTSAGRIPTDKGYRLFVDKLTAVKPLSLPERRAIQNFLDGAVDLDDVVGRTVRLLAQLTRQVAVVQYPSLTRSTVRHVELLALAPARLMLVLITDTGRVEQRLIDC